jgi:D-threo-aldose 1-dehydrogenase
VPLRAAAARFPLTHPAVASVLIGARSAAEVTDALRLRALDIPAALWDLLAAQAAADGAQGAPEAAQGAAEAAEAAEAAAGGASQKGRP